MIDKRQPSYNQFPVHYLEMRWLEVEVDVEWRLSGVETQIKNKKKIVMKKSPASPPLQGLAPPQTPDLPPKLPDTSHEIPIN